MEKENIIQHLKTLSESAPSPSFARGSKALIVSSPQNRPFFFYALKPAVFAALTFSLVAAFGIYFAGTAGNGGVPEYVSLDSQNLRDEFDTLQLSITLDEIAYRQTVHRTIASALTEISSDDVAHLNRSVLETEQNSFDIDTSSNSEIDDLLETIIF